MRQFYVVAMLALSTIPAVPQTAPTAKDSNGLCTQHETINAYSGTLDGKLKSLPQRTFGKSFSGTGPWRSVRSDHEGPVAHVFMQDGRPIVVVLVLSTESGDWVLEATYYYRIDGTLAKKHELLNTFYGDASVTRDTFYSCSGSPISKSVRHLDLKTKEEKSPDPEFVDEASPEYKRVQQLPFLQLLNSGRKQN